MAEEAIWCYPKPRLAPHCNNPVPPLGCSEPTQCSALEAVVWTGLYVHYTIIEWDIIWWKYLPWKESLKDSSLKSLQITHLRTFGCRLDLGLNCNCSGDLDTCGSYLATFSSNWISRSWGPQRSGTLAEGNGSSSTWHLLKPVIRHHWIRNTSATCDSRTMLAFPQTLSKPAILYLWMCPDRWVRTQQCTPWINWTESYARVLQS